MRGPAAVHVGGVEKIDAQIQSPIHDGEAVLFAGHPAEIHGPQAKITDQYSMLSQALALYRH
jgi:hypothetical protein